ncbi:hypothetical protein [Photobacterium rosenbergii]|uniref:Uncharacterized protein n=1 Tax=Photobacterium rosenbergii TaxID=294936 RepID=A0ABU3ZBM3_9GAMM|nr:hypothetical protein [Photobacterium rosenbergii]MDV5167506.1 hypothetical protein [Photobacterium rosenbergii]
MSEEQTKFTFEQPDIKPLSTKKDVQVTDRPLVGKIANQIGTGQNAKDSFIWMTITWSFYISTGLSLAFFFRSLLPGFDGVETLESIKNIWSIFTPIITLALGYAFGKGQ